MFNLMWVWKKSRQTDFASMQSKISHPLMNNRSESSQLASSCLSTSAVRSLLSLLTFSGSLPPSSTSSPPLFLLPRSSPSTLISQAARISFMPGKDFFLPTPWAGAVNNDNGSVVTSLVEPRSTAVCQTRGATVHAQKPFLCLWPCASPFLPPPSPNPPGLPLRCSSALLRQ